MSDISNEYGKALFLTVFEDEEIEAEKLTEIQKLREILQSNKAYLKLLSSPKIPMPERISLIEDCFGGRINRYTVSFLKIMCGKGYTKEIIPCLLETERLYFESHGIIRAKITSAVELSPSQKKNVLTSLEKKLSHKIIPEWITDKELIGGICVEADGMVFDGSIKARLYEVREKLLSTTLR